MKKVLLYAINPAEKDDFVNILKDSGAKVHLLKNEDLHKVLLDVLESEESLEYEEPKYNMTLCLFAGYNKEEIYSVIDKLTEKGMTKPVFATVTQKNIHWKIGALMTDVNMEHQEMAKIKRPEKV